MNLVWLLGRLVVMNGVMALLDADGVHIPLTWEGERPAWHVGLRVSVTGTLRYATVDGAPLLVVQVRSWVGWEG